MTRKPESARVQRHESGPAGPAMLYTMASYSGGIRKPGHFQLLTYEEGQSDRVHYFVPHRHDFFEIIWLPDSQGSVQIDLRTYPVVPRTLFVTAPGQVHSWQFTTAPKGEIISFTQDFFLTSSDHPGLLGRMPFFFSGQADPILHLDEEEGRQIGHLFTQLREAAENPLPGRDDIVRAYLTVLLIQARRSYLQRHPTEPPKEDDTLSQRFRLALEERFPHLLEVGDYAELLQVSRSRLNDDLRRHTGHSASEIIHERILLEAKRLLVHSSFNISEIAYQLRFQDPSYFGRFFRKATGQSPGAYREQAHQSFHG